MSEKRIRGLRFYLEYEYSSETKDQIEDLIAYYSSIENVLTKAISTLHEQHFGSIEKKTLPDAYIKTFSPRDDTASIKLDELLQYIQKMKDQYPHTPALEANNTSQQVHLSDKANEKIIEKIEELGMRFSKIISQEDQKTGQKTITAEMTNEEVLQLIKRIDQLESKLTKAISQSRVAAPSSVTGRSSIKEFGEPPKIGEIKIADGKQHDPHDRPLLDDVLDTVIVSVEKEE